MNMRSLSPYKIHQVKTCKNTADFIYNDIKSVISEVKNGKSRDQNGLIREIFTRGGESLTYSVI